MKFSTLSFIPTSQQLGLAAGLLAAAPARATVRLPRLVSDGLVLQRATPLRIWGWAAAGEKVSVAFLGKTYATTTDPGGQWRVTLPALEAGGPYELTVDGRNHLVVKDVLVGDVWLCSGQSNMELPMRRVRDRYPEVIAHSTNPRIRQFAIPLRYAFNGPKADVTGGSWVAATPETVLDFTAVGYFFAQDIYAKYQVPIGLIKNAVGGSPAEAWLSADALKQFPRYEATGAQWRDSALVASTKQREGTAVAAWYQRLHQADQGEQPSQPKWSSPAYDASAWATMPVPGNWATQTPLGPVNGVVWFRKEVEVPAGMAGQPGRLELGTLVDADSTYLNGQLVGSTSYRYPPRKYDFGPGGLRAGKNVITVRLISNGGPGGFTPDKQYRLTAGGQTLDLRGAWQYKLGAATPATPGSTTFQYQPGGLYNGLVAPVLNYALKGVLWYQGESNTSHPADYYALTSSLIQDWRTHFGQPDLPFLLVQLANINPAKKEPGESSQALVRDAQRRLLALPRTGLAVITDVGEWNDIHPLDKQTVGHRLALAAERVAYGDKKVVAEGPLYQSARPEGNKLVVKFADVGGGLVAKGGPLDGFTVAGADRQFVPATARIEGDQVVVSSPAVAAPVAVRYAWADNPEGANLYNQAGLPASTFRSDDF